MAETGAGKFQVEVSAGGISFLADEPIAVGGLGSGPGPFNLLSAALGACTAMTCRLYATQKGWPLTRVIVQLEHAARTATTKDRFTRAITCEGDLDEEQRQRLRTEIAAAAQCIVTLTEGVEIETRLAEVVPTTVQSRETDHFDQMEEACAEC